jgi:hypothetical protein
MSQRYFCASCGHCADYWLKLGTKSPLSDESLRYGWKCDKGCGGQMYIHPYQGIDFVENFARKYGCSVISGTQFVIQNHPDDKNWVWTEDGTSNGTRIHHVNCTRVAVKAAAQVWKVVSVT